ncbi:MAG: aldo/keto reductase [Geminicoccaceae bacterium]
MERRELAKGHDICRIIKGGWQLAGGHGPVDRARAIADMRLFFDAGMDTFDCADIYTGVEEMIGAFIDDLHAGDGSEAASRVCVHTKCVPDEAMLGRLRRVDIEAIVDRSLARLRVERLDLVQFHWWNYDVDGYLDAWGYLQELRKVGKIRHLGITNFDADICADCSRPGAIFFRPRCNIPCSTGGPRVSSPKFVGGPESAFSLMERLPAAF